LVSFARSHNDRAAAALTWIVSTLNQHEVSYQVVGGLAALAYGGTRPLHDIDLYAPLSGRPGLLTELHPYTVWGPEHFQDAARDLVFMKIDFDGIRIEIGDSVLHPRLFDAQQHRWVDQRVDYDRSHRRVVLGVPVDVMPLADLLDYKRALGRPVDMQDITELSGPTGANLPPRSDHLD
jgi:hypothetical protein